MSPQLAMGRRGFLRLAGFSAAMATLSRLGIAGASVASGQEGARGLLSEGDARILSAIGERMVFTGAADMPRFADTGAVATIDTSLHYVDRDVVDQLHWGLLLFQYGPPFFDGRVATYTGLAPEAQDEYLRGWAESRFAFRRLAFQAFKNLSFLGYYAQDATWAGIHYDGPWAPRPRRLAPQA